MSDGGAPSFMQTAGHRNLMLSYAENSCGECHKGVDLVQAPSYTKKVPNSVVFNHNDHIQEKADSLKCADCHVAETKTEGDREYAFDKGVMDCSKCHDHQEEHMKDTGNKDQAYVNGCVACHEVHEPGIPALDSTLMTNRVDITAINGSQFHPLPSKTRCSECHRPESTQEDSLPGTLNLVLSKTTYERPKDFHGMHERSGQQTPKYCYACHWNSFETLNQSDVNFAIKGGSLVDIKGQPYSRTRNGDAIRRELGGQLQGFPGILTK